MRFIESDGSLSLRGAQLKEAIAIDKKQNLIPFFVSIFITIITKTLIENIRNHTELL